LTLNDSRLFVDQDEDDTSIYIDSEASGEVAIEVYSKYGIYSNQDISGGRAAYFTRNIAEAGSYPLVLIIDDHTSNANPALKIQQDGASADAINIDYNGTTGQCIDIQAPLSTTGTCLLIQNANALTTGGVAEFHSNSAETDARKVVYISNDDALASGATCLYIQQDSTAPALVAMGNVGIGTAAPGSLLTVSTADPSITPHANADEFMIENSGDVGMTLASTGLGSIFFADAGSSVVGQLAYNHGDNTLSFVTNSAAVMVMDSSQNVTVSAGDLIMGTSGKGISFAATADAATAGATMTSETLDDYEEGTWTGVVTDGTNPMTMTNDTGYYTKVGNLVTVSGYFNTSSLGTASGNIRMTGLPFTITSNNAAYSGGAVGYGAGLAITGGHTVSYYVELNTTYIDLNTWDVTGGTSPMQASEWTADGGIILGFSYRAA